MKDGEAAALISPEQGHVHREQEPEESVLYKKKHLFRMTSPALQKKVEWKTSDSFQLVKVKLSLASAS